MRDWRVNSLSEIEWIIILEDFRDSLPARFSLVRKYTVQYSYSYPDVFT